MDKGTKRSRSSNWNHDHTMALAELKREASLQKEGGREVWERIAQTLSSRFPGHVRTGDQCRRRWDTLVKVYNHVEDYCVVTGAQDHRELDQGEWDSMKLDTAYRQDWYEIVKEVCSQRKRKERCDRDPILAKWNEESSSGSHAVQLPEHSPPGDTLYSVTHHEQSTTSHAQVSCSPLMESDKLSPEEEVHRLQNGNGGVMLAAAQLRQPGEGSHEVSQEPQTLESPFLLPHTFFDANGDQLKDRLPDILWDDIELCAMPFETTSETEQPERETELMDLS